MAENPNLFGRIALAEGDVTPDQLEECLAIQAKIGPGRSLGEIFVEKRYVSRERLAAILRIQEARFEKIDADPGRGGLFGRLAVRLGFLTPARLHEALRVQEARGRGESALRLGQILLEKKFLTVDQFLEVLRRQKKEVAVCPICQAFYDVAEGARGGPFVCFSCETVIHPPAGGARPPSAASRKGA